MTVAIAMPDFYSLLGTAQLNELGIKVYLRHLFERLPEQPNNRTEKRLPCPSPANYPISNSPPDAASMCADRKLTLNCSKRRNECRPPAGIRTNHRRRRAAYL